VSQVHFSLPRACRVAAVVLALTVPAAPALAAGEPTGGTAAGTTAKPKAKKVSVKRIQKALGIKADGVLGPKTRRAIKRFQKAHGLKADGVAGPATLRALGLLQPPAPASLASLPADAAAALAQIAQCESGGDITAVSRDGRFRGKYQFSQETWEALGGTGDPAAADEPTQDAFAAALYTERGAAPWPACSAQVTATED